MESKPIKRVKNQKLATKAAQLPQVENSGSISARSNFSLPGQYIKCHPMTFSQKMYQFNEFTFTAQEIAEQFEYTFTDADSWDKANKLLEKIVEIAN